jgi:tRNA nucleotidyltransferase/poly(A) polymerase
MNNNKYFLNDEITRKLLEICPEKAEFYIVGGFIRDMMLKKECFDRDFAVKNFSAIKFAQKAAEILGGYFVVLDEIHDIARVIMPDKKNTLDFAGCVGEDIYSDLANRDFTINALACRVKDYQCEIIDPTGGIKDLEKGLIKAVSEKNLSEDPIRLFRAFRLQSQFNFEIEEKTLEMIQEKVGLLNKVALERVNMELVKLFEGESSAKSLVLMKQTNVLFEIFPELIPQKTVPANLHHHLCLIDHSIESVNQLENEFKKFPLWAKEHFFSEFSVNIKRISLLKLSTLLHDIGKPSTWSIDQEGRHRFIKHEEIGSEQAFDILKRLRFSKNSVNYITLLIKNHLYPSQLIREGLDNLSEKPIMRFFRRINQNVPDLLILALADRLSARGVDITEDIVQKNISGIYYLLQKYKESMEEIKTLPKLLDGREVMKILNIPKGPEVGKVLNALKEAQISGDVNTKEEALEFLKDYKK